MAPKRATPRKPLATPRKRSATADPASSWEEDSSGSSTPHDQEVADEEMRESESEEVEDSAAAAAAVDENDEEEESAEDWSEGEGEEESTEDGSEWEAEPDLQPASKNPPQSNKSPTRKRGKTPAPVHQNGENKPQHSESAEPKPKKSRRTWSPDDEVLILEELAKHRRQHGKVPAWGDYAFFESVAKRLEDSSCHYFVVKEKVRTLLRRYKSHILSTTDHDKRLDNLSEDVWGDFQVTDDDPINGGKQAEGEGAMVRAENGSSGQTHARSFDEMCEVYPLLGLEVKMLAEVQLAVKSLFTRLDAKKALYMQKKLERIWSTEVKIQARMAAKVHAPKAKISEKLVRLLT